MCVFLSENVSRSDFPYQGNVKKQTQLLLLPVGVAGGGDQDCAERGEQSQAKPNGSVRL